MIESHFSSTYAQARRRFQDAAETAAAKICSYPINVPDTKGLTIDIACIGLDETPTVVISSGVHGIEGFFGSAIQHAFLVQLAQAEIKPSGRFVLIHAVNPFGFSRLRRCNEDNIDLNRNFLSSAHDYQGAPDSYAKLNKFLNPASLPPYFEPFRLKAIWNIWRHGFEELKSSVATGQYEYPNGLFFGGYGPSKSAQVIFESCHTWIGSSKRVLHIDFHSGLGRFADYNLLVNESQHQRDFSWYINAFGSHYVQSLSAPMGTVYKVSGSLGEWMQEYSGIKNYRFVTAEFGTYNVIRVLKALRAENRAHHYGEENSVLYKKVKQELFECFCPQSSDWRKKVIMSGLKIIGQGTKALMNL